MAKYRFGDIVREVKDKVDRDNNPYEYYIAGDHMDTDELHLLRQGAFAGSDVGPAFIRIFKPGQVLYGSRRTYLRKVAVADFEGVTANTTFVLESKDETILLQSLLPFIMQADRFVQHSIKRSKGSTNPYVLFSDLADYEVNLPSIEEQRKLSDLLWAIDGVKMSYKKLISATDDLVKSQFIEMFGGAGGKSKYDTITLGSISKMVSGGTPSSKHPEYFGGTIPFVSTPCLGPNYIDSSAAQNWLTELGVDNSSTHIVPERSLLVGNRVGVGKCSINLCKMCTNQDILSFVDIDTDKYDLLFLKKVVEQYEQFFESKKRGATIKGVTSDLVKATNIPKAPIAVQRDFVDFVEESDKSKFAIAICSNLNLLSSLIYRLLKAMGGISCH